MATNAGEEASVEPSEPMPETSIPASEPTSESRPLTPGQRLAVRKAAKAKRKAELKGTADTAAEELAGEVEKAAEEFTDFWSENQQRILMGIGVGLVIGVAALLYSRYADSGAAAEAEALYEGVEITQGEIDPESTSGKDADEKPIFPSLKDRAAQAVQSFSSLQKQHPGSAAAAWGLVAQGATQLEYGDAKAASVSFGKVVQGAGAQVDLKARALEGAALAAEQAEKPDEALSTLLELGKLDREAYRDLAEYHMARIHLAKGDRKKATELLKGVYDRLSAPEPGAPPTPYLKFQVELLLMELDSSLVDRPAAAPSAMPGMGGLGGLGGDMSPEQLQELIRNLQQKQQPGSP